MLESAQNFDSDCTDGADSSLVLSTRDLEATEVRARWEAALDSTYFELDVDWPDQPDAFVGELSVRSFADLEVGLVRADPHVVVRTPDMISSDSNDDYLLCVIPHGAVVIRQNANSVRLGGGAFALLDSSVPFVITAHTPFEQIVVRAPRAEVARHLPLDAVAQVVGQDFSARNGVGRYLSHLIVDMATDDSLLSPHVTASVAACATDLLAAAIAERTAPFDTTGKVHAKDLRAIQQAMERHMDDAGYSISIVSAELGMSVRYIHKLFSTTGTTPQAWLIQKRLERARKLLLSTDATISAISTHVGFRDVSHFSRAFRRHFGANPKSFRVQKLASGSAGDAGSSLRSGMQSGKSTAT
ncbi:helix-turn-helix domain-containing protein [Gordonia terrae]